MPLWFAVDRLPRGYRRGRIEVETGVDGVLTLERGGLELGLPQPASSHAKSRGSRRHQLQVGPGARKAWNALEGR